MKKNVDINLLNDNIKNKIIFNKIIFNKNNYIDNINYNDDILNIDKNLSNKCFINDIYNNNDKIKIENMECIVIDVNKDIYKYYPGFFTFNQFNKYKNMKINKYTSFSSKYVAYTKGKLNYTGLVSYKLIDTIKLIDLYNINNISNIIKLIKNITLEDYNLLKQDNKNIIKILKNNNDNELEIFKNNLIEYLTISTGYNIKLIDQINYYDKLYNNKLIYYLYDKYKCNYDNKLKPLYITKYDDILFYIINYYIPYIDGFIKKELFSYFNNIEEEIYIRHISLNKLQYNREDKLNWINWVIKPYKMNKIYKGIILRLDEIYDNNNFSLLKYYISNNISNNIIKKK